MARHGNNAQAGLCIAGSTARHVCDGASFTAFSSHCRSRRATPHCWCSNFQTLRVCIPLHALKSVSYFQESFRLERLGCVSFPSVLLPYPSSFSIISYPFHHFCRSGLRYSSWQCCFKSPLELFQRSSRVQNIFRAPLFPL